MNSNAITQQDIHRTAGISMTIRHKEHIRYIRTNNPTSPYAMHILNNRYEYGRVDETLKLLQPCNKKQK